jgi:hypothetical protein
MTGNFFAEAWLGVAAPHHNNIAGTRMPELPVVNCLVVILA